MNAITEPANWEQIFQTGRQWNRYPPEELIRFCSTLNTGIVYDFGCGPGAGPSWYLAREGWNYIGWDQAPTAIEQTRERLTAEGLHARFAQTGQLENESVDLFIDVQSLQHCKEPERHILEARRILKPGGRIFSMWISNGSHTVAYDDFGYTNFIGPKDLLALFKNFDPHLARSTRSTKLSNISLFVLTGTK